jgi:hypothetical protein
MRVNKATSSSWSFIGRVCLVLRKLQSRFLGGPVSGLAKAIHGLPSTRPLH